MIGRCEYCLSGEDREKPVLQFLEKRPLPLSRERLIDEPALPLDSSHRQAMVFHSMILSSRKEPWFLVEAIVSELNFRLIS